MSLKTFQLVYPEASEKFAKGIKTNFFFAKSAITIISEIFIARVNGEAYTVM